MAVGRDLFSDLDLRLPQLEFRAVWHSGITLTFRPREYSVLIRPRTTMLSAAAPHSPARPLAPPWQEAIVPIADALLSLVAAVESGPTAGPAVKAFQAAIRRKGEEAAAAGGPDAMEAALRIVAGAAQDRAERRTRIIDKAWAGLTGWRPEDGQPR